MTECERLVKEGKFSPDWFKPEVRCDFLVDKNRKKLWAIILDLLIQFDAVCKKHGLRYFGIGGTAIGAVRHGGIIPWDDDVDVGMFRADYEKMLKLGNEFSNPYFLKVPGENGYFCSFAKLCNSNTAAIYESTMYCKYNQGIFLDIFPVDTVDIADGERWFTEIDNLNRANGLLMRMSHPNPSKSDIERFSDLKLRDGMANLRQIEKLTRQYEKTDVDGVGLTVFTGYAYQKNVWPKEYFKEEKMFKFENTVLPIPCGYDLLLKKTFGNYMEFPPVEQRGVRHGNFEFMPDVPYKNILAIKALDECCIKSGLEV